MAFTRGSILSAVIVALVGLNAQSMKTWPEQKKSQTGLSEPQDPATLPKSTVSPQKPVAKPVVQGPVLKETGPSQWSIRGGWKLAPAPAVTQSGDALSRSGILLTGEWLDAVVPGTVLTTLVDRGIYPDPDYGLNNLAIPETLN
ncbi:MAG: hypothetical protein M1541_10865, partial [Acidobacteria bacterium]|nr:hypothetical protein [Acidobacteriota bacterium]